MSEITAIVRDVMADLSPSIPFDEPANWDVMDLVAVVVDTVCQFGVIAATQAVALA